MHYDQLPVFKAAYDLLLEVFRSSHNMKREYRYTLGEELKKDLKQLPVRNMALVALHCESISKQLTSWHKSVKHSE